MLHHLSVRRLQPYNCHIMTETRNIMFILLALTSCLHVFISECTATDIVLPPPQIKIGGIFGRFASQDALDAFTAAVQFVNSRTDLLPDVQLTYVLDQVLESNYSSLSVIQSAWNMASEQVAIVIVPSTSSDVRMMYPVLSSLGIPQITPWATDPNLSAEPDTYPFLFKLRPPDNFQSKALVELIRHFGWSEIAIIASSSDYGQNGLKAFQTEALSNHWTLSSIQYFAPHPNMTGDAFVNILSEIKVKGTRIIVLNCLAPHAKIILEQARQMQMTEEGWAWIVTDGVTSLNTLFPPCQSVPYHQRGLLGTRLPEPKGALYQNYTELVHETNMDNEVLPPLVFDSVLVAAYALNDFLEDGNVYYPPPSSKPSVCLHSDLETWSLGDTIRDYIQNVSGDGVMKYINFTAGKYVGGSSYDIVNLQRRGWVKVGEWISDAEQEITLSDKLVLFPDNTDEVPTDRFLAIENVTFRIVAVVEAPYIMLAEDPPDTNNSTLIPAVYTGYSVDLIKRLQRELHFEYEIYLAPDGQYGDKDDVTGEWDGVMGELISGNADMIIAPLTISYEREQFVDFTKPYLDLGALILMAKTKTAQSLLSFFDPFHWALWLVVLAACVFCGILNTLVSWCSPYGHRGRYSSRLRPSSSRYKGERNVFNLWNSLWYSFSQWMMQGAENIPPNLSGRIVYGVWYFVIMVISATYTANLAAFLTVQRLDTGINSLADLAQQTAIRYGVVDNTALKTFFANTDSDPYATINHRMHQDDTFVTNTSEGVRKVRESYGRPKEDQFAFITDSVTAELVASNPPCETRVIGRVFNNLGYGLAFQSGSPYVDIFSIEILKLRQNGFMSGLKKRYLSSGTCTPGTEVNPRSNTQQATLENMAGVFLFMLIGSILVVPVIVCECCVAAKRDSKSLHKQKKGSNVSFAQSLIRRVQEIYQDMRLQKRVFFGAPDPLSDSSEDEATRADHDKDMVLPIVLTSETTLNGTK